MNKDNWISVEERLPDTQEPVITFPYSIVTIRYIKLDEENNKVWFFDAIPVTHWQPLPEPPKNNADYFKNFLEP